MSWSPEQKNSEWPFDLQATTFRLDPKSTAVLVIDMQHDQAAIGPESDLAKQYPEIGEYWNHRVEHLVVPNIRRLIDFSRSHESGEAAPAAAVELYPQNGGFAQ